MFFIDSWGFEIDFEELTERILNNNHYEKQYLAIIHSLQDISSDKSVKYQLNLFYTCIVFY
ncbi:MAG: hypothetical protein BWZ06_00317 [Bacteroidetes bacterium ADurb.BinA261]|nr:MAG: hypothetical protein BWZ06_00317 [Bacteroidetes bacterium ADurb.BinA261]